MIHLAQLGAGHWGPNLIRNFMQLDEVGEFTVCDVNTDRLEKIKRQYPAIKVTSQTDEVFEDPNIQAVVVATPASLHYEFAIRALASQKHVLVEKPLSTRTEEADKLVSLAQKQQKILMVGHTFLYNPVVRKAKEYIDSGMLGDIYYIMAQRLNLGRVRHDINALWNLAPHDISIILYWLGEEPSKISAKGLTFIQKDIEDVVFMDLEFPSGRAAHIHVSWLDPTKTRKMVIVGSKKMLVYDDVSIEKKITIYDKGIDKQNIIRELPDVDNYAQFHFTNRSGDIYIPKIDFEEPLRLECKHFVNCVLNGTNPVSDGRNGLAVVKILDSAQKCLGSKINGK